MDIVARIKYFLEENNIANSQFADKCDIPRPTVSQLLNGRNKKISNEVISKIHAAYPNLSIMWLMFGEKPMILQSETSDDMQISETQSKWFEDETAAPEENERPNRIVFDDNLSDELDANEDGMGSDGKENEAQTFETVIREVNRFQQQKKSVSTDKRIVNVMVFYSDNSFESFVPSSQ